MNSQINRKKNEGRKYVSPSTDNKGTECLIKLLRDNQQVEKPRGFGSKNTYFFTVQKKTLYRTPWLFFMLFCWETKCFWRFSRTMARDGVAALARLLKRYLFYIQKVLFINRNGFFFCKFIVIQMFQAERTVITSFNCNCFRLLLYNNTLKAFQLKIRQKCSKKKDFFFLPNTYIILFLSLHLGAQ